MSQRERKSNLSLILLTSVSAIAVVGLFAFVLLLQSLNDVTKSVALVQEQVSELTNKSDVGFASSQPNMQAAIQAAIKDLEQQKVQDALDAKFANYTLAVDRTKDDRSIYGNEKARFTLVEFSDLECPFCRKFHDTPKKIVDMSDGAVNWEWKHFPLGFHNPMATVEAVAAECVREDAGNKAFWVFLEEIFNNSRGNGQGVASLDESIKTVGADVAKVKACISEGKFEKKVNEDMALGQRQGVTGTPATFVVDNKTGKVQMLSGAQPTEAIVAVIKRMIADERDAQEKTEVND